MSTAAMLVLTTACLIVSPHVVAQTLEDGLAHSEPWSKPLWVIHRGGEVERPENTMVAITHSVELGARYIEIDLHATDDGKIVLLHDDTLDRTTSGSGRVGEHTWAQIRDLDAGSWKDPSFSHARIPLLSEVLGFCKQNGVRVLLDVKDPAAAGASLWELLNQFDMVDDCRVYMRAGASVAEVKAALDSRLTLFPDSLIQGGGAGTPREKMQRSLDSDNPAVVGTLVRSYQWVLDFYSQVE
jgi:hypothetical protein